MDRHSNAEVLASMTMAEFRQFRKALRVLQVSHVNTLEAIDILVAAYVQRTRFRHTA